MSRHQEYAMERAKVLFGGYRRSDANNPEIYVPSIAAVLALYDEELIREVTDPRTGISTTEKFAAFLPNPGELKAHCEARAAHRERISQYNELPPVDLGRLALPAPEPRPGRRANVIVPKECPRYEEMRQRASKADSDPAEWEWHEKGIKVAISWWLKDRAVNGLRRM